MLAHPTVPVPMKFHRLYGEKIELVCVQGSCMCKDPLEAGGFAQVAVTGEHLICPASDMDSGQAPEQAWVPPALL